MKQEKLNDINNDPKQARRGQIATGIALAFHISGFIAIGFFKSEFFIRLTPLNLLVCLLLIIWTQHEIKAGFLVFCLAAFGIGFGAEYVGVNYGLLFGNYQYGNLLGTSFHGVPLIIGVQWLVTIYCIGVSMFMLQEKLLKGRMDEPGGLTGRLRSFSMLLDGAILAVVFDWVIEPVAIKLGYWQWHEAEVPWSNYLSWYGISLVILAIFYYTPFRKHNLFGVHLLLIQFMFFLLLRTLFKYNV